MLLTRKKVAAPILLITLINLTVFWSKIHGQFLADDFGYFTKISRFIFSPQGVIDLGIYGPYFRPLPLLVWLPLSKLVGMVPAWYHAVVLILHIANSVMVYFSLRKAFQENVAFVSACIFSVFTGHIEAVMASHNLFDIFCAQFFLLSLLFLTVFLETKRSLFYVFSLGAAVLAIFSKENAVTLPAIVLAFSFIWFYRNGFELKRLLSPVMLCLPYFLLYSCYVVLRFYVSQRYELQKLSFHSFLDPKLLSNYSVFFKSLIIPFGKDSSIPNLAPFAIGAFLIALVLCFYGRRESRKAIALGLIWMVVTASPTLRVAWLGGRLNYLPSVGFCLVMGQMLTLAPGSLRGKRLALLLPCAAVFIYSLNTIFDSSYWVKAWRTSKAIQESFKAEVEPVLEKPARAYFFQVPEYEDGIAYFPIGLPQCFSLLSEKKGCSYYMAVQRSRPRVRSPQETKCESSLPNQYFFEWDSSKGRFRHIGTVLKDSQRSGRNGNAQFSWDFSKYHEFRQWEPAHDLLVFFDNNTMSHKFVTTGESSFLQGPHFLTTGESSSLKSAYMGVKIKCVEIIYRATNRGNTPLSGQLLWITENDLIYDGKKSITFPVRNDESLHIYTLPLYINAWAMREPILQLALRLSNRPETLIEVKSVTIYLY